jgi:1-acyl-sn-glycerol-3-phosphate acyltransferase
MNRILYLIGWMFWSLVLRVYNRYTVHGRQHIPPAGKGIVIAANHTSYFDPPLVGIAFFERIWFLARDSLFTRSRFFGWLIRSVNAVPISRERLDLRTMRTVQQLCAEGRKVLIFPEGTRSADGELQPGLAGVGLFVDKIGADVLPMCIEGSYAAFPRHSRWPRPKRIHVYIGEPLRATDWQDLPRGRERYQRIADDIMASIKQLQDAARTHATCVPARAASGEDTA